MANQSDKALRERVTAMRKGGKTDAEVREALRADGHEDECIEEALAGAGADKDPVAQEHGDGAIGVAILSLILSMIAMGVALYAAITPREMAARNATAVAGVERQLASEAQSGNTLTAEQVRQIVNQEVRSAVLNLRHEIREPAKEGAHQPAESRGGVPGQGNGPPGH